MLLVLPRIALFCWNRYCADPCEPRVEHVKSGKTDVNVSWTDSLGSGRCINVANRFYVEYRLSEGQPNNRLFLALRHTTNSYSIKDCRSDEVARWSTLGQTCNFHGRWRHRAVGVFVTTRATLSTASDCADFFFLQEMSFAKVDVGVKYCPFLRMRTEKVL